MCDICDDFENQTVISEVRIKVAKLCALHPVYEQNK
jgi:hypothetical protein